MVEPGTLLQGRYRITRQLGQGGMGTVYEAIDGRFEGRVAIKEAHLSEPTLRKQFQQEARLLYNLRHRALPRVIDHFSEGSGQFLVMDFVEGEDLGSALERTGRAFPVSQVLSWGDELLDALTYLHSQNPPIIHRDIKPHNLKVSLTGQIVLLDFGLAKVSADTNVSHHSIFGYTPTYAPIEQIQGNGTDPRSDFYSLAASLYHLVTGKPPRDVLTRLAAVTDGESDCLERADNINPNVSSAIASVLESALALGRNHRPTNAGEFRAALREAGTQLTPTVSAASYQHVSPQPLRTIPGPKIQPYIATHLAEPFGTPRPRHTQLNASGEPKSNRNLLIGSAATALVLIFFFVSIIGFSYYYRYASSGSAIASPNSNNDKSSVATTSTRPLDAEVHAVEVYMAKYEGAGVSASTTRFSASERTVHVVINLSKAQVGTNVKVVWFADEVVGARNRELKTLEYTTKGLEKKIPGFLRWSEDWPKGRYRVAVYINGNLDRTIYYDVQ